MFTISALKIHVSPQCKEVLDTFSTFDLEFRGNIEMKVSMGLTWVPERERGGGRERDRGIEGEREKEGGGRPRKRQRR